MIVGVAGIPGALVWHLATYQRKIWARCPGIFSDLTLNSFGSVFLATVH
eukprot:g40960.t1